MKDFFALKILDLFKGLYKIAGVDYEIMRLIVQSKLLMDTRRVGNNVAVSGEGEKTKNTFLTSLIVYAIMGVISSAILFLDIEPIVKMSFYFGFFMIMILTSFISDFSTVMLDIKDKDIIGTKGVDLKTLNAAKITHIFIYISMLSLAISGCGLLVSLRFGIDFFLLFLVSILLIDIFMIIVTASMYFIIIKLFSGEKLKDVLNMFQIVFLLIFTLGYQVVIQSFNIVDINILYEPKLWNLVVPPMWFASNFNIIKGIGISNMVIGLSVLSIVVPLISIIMYIKLVPVFESSLEKLNDNTYKSKNTKESFASKISNLMCKDKEEKVFFNFINNILSKDREFKMKIYPSLAMGAFMPFLMMIVSIDKSDIAKSFYELQNSSFFLTAYLGAAISQNVITMISYSSEYEASWIYDILPVRNKSNIYSASAKVVIYRFILPIFAVMSVGFILIFKIRVISHLVVILMANIIVSMITFKMSEKVLPFSKKYETASSTSNIGVVIKSMVVVGALALVHFLVSKSILLTCLYALILGAVIVLSWRKIFKKMCIKLN
ncbi:MAG: hypothetical protein RRZ84_06135 [Romboutsia sp.]